MALAPEESEMKKLPKQNRRMAFGTMNQFRFSILHLMEMNEKPHYLVSEDGIIIRSGDILHTLLFQL